MRRLWEGLIEVKTTSTFTSVRLAGQWGRVHPPLGVKRVTEDPRLSTAEVVAGYLARGNVRVQFNF